MVDANQKTYDVQVWDRADSQLDQHCPGDMADSGGGGLVLAVAGRGTLDGRVDCC